MMEINNDEKQQQQQQQREPVEPIDADLESRFVLMRCERRE